MNILYLLSFIGYGSLSWYYYIHNDKWALGWLLLAILNLAFYVIEEIKEFLIKNKN